MEATLAVASRVKVVPKVSASTIHRERFTQVITIIGRA